MNVVYKRSVEDLLIARATTRTMAITDTSATRAHFFPDDVEFIDLKFQTHSSEIYLMVSKSKITKLSKCEQISGVINTTTFTVKWNLTDSQVATINLIVSRLTVLCLSCPIPMQGSGNNSQTGYLAQVCLWNRYQYRYR